MDLDISVIESWATALGASLSFFVPYFSPFIAVGSQYQPWSERAFASIRFPFDSVEAAQALISLMDGEMPEGPDGNPLDFVNTRESWGVALSGLFRILDIPLYNLKGTIFPPDNEPLLEAQVQKVYHDVDDPTAIPDTAENVADGSFELKSDKHQVTVKEWYENMVKYGGMLIGSGFTVPAWLRDPLQEIALFDRPPMPPLPQESVIPGQEDLDRMAIISRTIEENLQQFTKVEELAKVQLYLPSLFELFEFNFDDYNVESTDDPSPAGDESRPRFRLRDDLTADELIAKAEELAAASFFEGVLTNKLMGIEFVEGRIRGDSEGITISGKIPWIAGAEFELEVTSNDAVTYHQSLQESQPPQLTVGGLLAPLQSPAIPDALGNDPTELVSPFVAVGGELPLDTLWAEILESWGLVSGVVQVPDGTSATLSAYSPGYDAMSEDPLKIWGGLQAEGAIDIPGLVDADWIFTMVPPAAGQSVPQFTAEAAFNELSISGLAGGPSDWLAFNDIDLSLSNRNPDGDLLVTLDGSLNLFGDDALNLLTVESGTLKMTDQGVIGEILLGTNLVIDAGGFTLDGDFYLSVNTSDDTQSIPRAGTTEDIVIRPGGHLRFEGSLSVGSFTIDGTFNLSASGDELTVSGTGSLPGYFDNVQISGTIDEFGVQQLTFGVDQFDLFPLTLTDTTIELERSQLEDNSFSHGVHVTGTSTFGPTFWTNATVDGHLDSQGFGSLTLELSQPHVNVAALDIFPASDSSFTIIRSASGLHLNVTGTTEFLGVGLSIVEGVFSIAHDPTAFQPNRLLTDGIVLHVQSGDLFSIGGFGLTAASLELEIVDVSDNYLGDLSATVTVGATLNLPGVTEPIELQGSLSTSGLGSLETSLDQLTIGSAGTALQLSGAPGLSPNFRLERTFGSTGFRFTGENVQVDWAPIDLQVDVPEFSIESDGTFSLEIDGHELGTPQLKIQDASLTLRKTGASPNTLFLDIDGGELKLPLIDPIELPELHLGGDGVFLGGAVGLPFSSDFYLPAFSLGEEFTTTDFSHVNMQYSEAGGGTRLTLQLAEPAAFSVLGSSMSLDSLYVDAAGILEGTVTGAFSPPGSGETLASASFSLTRVQPQDYFELDLSSAQLVLPFFDTQVGGFIRSNGDYQLTGNSDMSLGDAEFLGLTGSAATHLERFGTTSSFGVHVTDVDLKLPSGTTIPGPNLDLTLAGPIDTTVFDLTQGTALIGNLRNPKPNSKDLVVSVDTTGLVTVARPNPPYGSLSLASSPPSVELKLDDLEITSAGAFNAEMSIAVGFLDIDVDLYVDAGGDYYFSGSTDQDISIGAGAAATGFDGKITVTLQANGGYSSSFSGELNVPGFGAASGSLSKSGCLSLTGKNKQTGLTKTFKFELADEDVCSGSSFSVPLSAIDGYISGGITFFDANSNNTSDFLDLNGNGMHDLGEPDEPTAITRADGQAVLLVPSEFDRNNDGQFSPDEGRIVVIGGIDSGTTLQLQTPLVSAVANGGTTIVSPLTTLVDGLIHNAQYSYDQALTAVKQQFGIPQGLDIAVTDPIAAVARGEQDWATVVAGNAKLQDTIVQLTHLASGATGMPVSDAAPQVIDSLAGILAAGDVNLSDVSRLHSVVETIGAVLGITFAQELLQATAEVIAAGNRATDEVSQGNESFLRNIARGQAAKQGAVALDLQAAAAGTLSPAELISRNTGGALSDLIANAEIGNIHPPDVFVSDVEFIAGQNGGMQLFTISLSQPSVVPVSVEYNTRDGSATSAAGDYTPVARTLQFAAGETDKQVAVAVRSADASDTRGLRLVLHDPVASLLGDPIIPFFLIPGIDGDNISPITEWSAPNSGDANLDGVLDATQSNVVSLPSSRNGSYVTFVAATDSTLENVASVPDPEPVFVGLDAPVGFLDFELHGVTPGGTATVTMIGADFRDRFVYWIFGPESSYTEPHYWAFYWDGEIGARNIDGQLVLQLRDGARGDADLTANGVIVNSFGAVASVGMPWQNPIDQLDVNNDGTVAPIDALVIINALNSTFPGGGVEKQSALTERAFFKDVSGDGVIAPNDVLWIINHLNGPLLLDPEAELASQEDEPTIQPTGRDGRAFVFSSSYNWIANDIADFSRLDRRLGADDGNLIRVGNEATDAGRGDHRLREHGHVLGNADGDLAISQRHRSQVRLFAHEYDDLIGGRIASGANDLALLEFLHESELVLFR